jgi:glycosyltransferase involved in cell wall biosynthesis
LVVPPRDPSALARAISQLLSDDQLRSRMGEEARKRAGQQFSQEIMLDRVIALYEDLLRSE